MCFLATYVNCWRVSFKVADLLVIVYTSYTILWKGWVCDHIYHPIGIIEKGRCFCHFFGFLDIYIYINIYYMSFSYMSFSFSYVFPYVYLKTVLHLSPHLRFYTTFLGFPGSQDWDTTFKVQHGRMVSLTPQGFNCLAGIKPFFKCKLFNIIQLQRALFNACFVGIQMTHIGAQVIFFWSLEMLYLLLHLKGTNVYRIVQACVTTTWPHLWKPRAFGAATAFPGILHSLLVVQTWSVTWNRWGGRGWKVAREIQSMRKKGWSWSHYLSTALQTVYANII